MVTTQAGRASAFHPSVHGLRAFTVVRNDRNPGAMRFEVIYQTGDRENPVSWAFFPTKAAAMQFAKEVR